MAEENKVVEEVKEEKAPVTIDDLRKGSKRVKTFLILFCVFLVVNVLVAIVPPLAPLFAIPHLVFKILLLVFGIIHIVRSWTFKGEGLGEEDAAFLKSTRIFGIVATAIGVLLP